MNLSNFYLRLPMLIFVADAYADCGMEQIKCLNQEIVNIRRSPAPDAIQGQVRAVVDLLVGKTSRITQKLASVDDRLLVFETFFHSNMKHIPIVLDDSYVYAEYEYRHLVALHIMWCVAKSDIIFHKESMRPYHSLINDAKNICLNKKNYLKTEWAEIYEKYATEYCLQRLIPETIIRALLAAYDLPDTPQNLKKLIEIYLPEAIEINSNTINYEFYEELRNTLKTYNEQDEKQLKKLYEQVNELVKKHIKGADKLPSVQKQYQKISEYWMAYEQLKDDKAGENLNNNWGVIKKNYGVSRQFIHLYKFFCHIWTMAESHKLYHLVFDMLTKPFENQQLQYANLVNLYFLLLNQISSIHKKH